MQADTGEVSDDDEEQEDPVEMNGDYKFERQNSKQGSLKRQIVKVSLLYLLCVDVKGFGGQIST